MISHVTASPVGLGKHVTSPLTFAEISVSDKCVAVNTLDIQTLCPYLISGALNV